MSRYMLDTNICIYLMKHQPPEVAMRFATCRAGEVVISAVTLAELEYGVLCSENRERNRKALDALLEDIRVAAFEQGAAQAYALVRQATHKRNRDALDKLIAAHAIALEVVLVTNNEQDFQNYPNLKIENWVGQPLGSS